MAFTRDGAKHGDTVLYYFDSLRGKFDPSNAQDIFALLTEAASHRDHRAAGNTDTTSHRALPDKDRLAAIMEVIRVTEVQVSVHLTLCVEGY